MRRRFFVEQFESGHAQLRGEAAEHLGRVLRAQPGQQYELSDGREVWLAQIETASKSSIEFALVEQLPAQVARLHTTLLLSIVKFDRFEWCLEKATELGVAHIAPVAAERSEKGLIAAATKRSERWRKILLESAQQARRVAVPILGEPAAAAEACAAIAPAALRVLLSEQESAPSLRRVLQGATAQMAALAIGPEGGWTEREFSAFTAAGFHAASLGGNILRTETAVIAALAAVNYALGEES